MEFYHQIITEKSFKFLQELKRKYQFILIGGWAVFFYSHSLKSKDIDIIVEYRELANLQGDYHFSKNERLKKYEIKFEEVDVDIYVPYYSFLGIDPAVVSNFTILREGFRLPILEMLFSLKLYAWQERVGSPKGKKDEIDIFSLAFLPEFDWEKYYSFIQEYSFEKHHREFISLLKKTKNIQELNINNYSMARLRKIILKQFKL